MPHDSHCRSERRTAARPVNAVLDLFEGDANATIGAMLAELQFVRRQLALCEAGVSVGFTRGWIPSFDREGDGNVEYSREPRQEMAFSASPKTKQGRSMSFSAIRPARLQHFQGRFARLSR